MEESTKWGMRFVSEEFHADGRDQMKMRRIAAAVALMLSASPALASTQEFVTPLPFAPSKEAFLEYMSKGDYTKDGKVEFFEAQGCGQPRDLTSLTGGSTLRLNENSYRCKEAYFRKSSPLGTEVCKVKNLYYRGARYWKGKTYPIRSGYMADRCRFKD